MVELSPSTPGVSGSNPVVDKIKLLSTVMKKGKNWPGVACYKTHFSKYRLFPKNQSLS